MDETTEAKTHQSCNLPSALINERDVVPAGKPSGERKERVDKRLRGGSRERKKERGDCLR